MRRMILSSLILAPVAAFAQTPGSNASQQPSSSAVLVAELSQPDAEATLAIKNAEAKAALPIASLAVATPADHAAIREVISTRRVESLTDAALMQGGTLEFSMLGSAPLESSPATITRAVELNLTPEELAEQPSVSLVVVHAIVDENGVPRNAAIAQSAGAAVDRKVLAAVSQYRFRPATLDNKPTWASVSISIKIQKP